MKNLILCFSLVIFACAASPISEIEQGNLGAGTAADKFYVHYPPDPVNLRTGNFYYAVQDLFLPCFGIPLEVFRSYNSFSRQNGPLGLGWTFNYDIKISIGDIGTLKVLEADGFLNEFKPKNQPEGPKGEVIDKIIEAKKEEDKQYLKRPREEEFYDKMRIKMATDDDYFKRLKTRYVQVDPKKVPDGEYVSYSRGTSTIIKKEGTFTRIKINGTKEYYNKDGDLTRVEDRNGNSLNFELDSGGRVKRVSDGCTHHLLFTYNQKGKIIQVSDSLGRILKYEYDSLDRLIAAKLSDGSTVKYSYNKMNMMEKLVYDNGDVIDVVFDPKKGVVTEQRGPKKKITKYSYGSKGPKHRWAIAEDNEGYYENVEFIDEENKIVQKDKSGKQTVTVISRTCSKPVSVTGDLGSNEYYKYDDAGNMLEKKDSSGNTVSYKYDIRFPILPTEIRDQTGKKLIFLYDERGNMTYANLEGTGWVKIRYDAKGKYQSLSDSKGNIINFAYNYFGKPTIIEKKIRDKATGAIKVKYKDTGEISEIKYEPNDTKVVDDVKKTLDEMLSLMRASGIDIQI
jgi:YD repeat-containing protein